MSIMSTGAGRHERPVLRLTYSIDELAKKLGIGRNTAYELARADALPVAVIRAGRRLLVSRAAVDRLLGGEGEAA